MKNLHKQQSCHVGYFHIINWDFHSINWDFHSINWDFMEKFWNAFFKYSVYLFIFYHL
jgi:hypothetical protein